MSLRDHTSFRVGGPADLFAEPADEEDLCALLGVLKEQAIPWFLLGGGANVLVSDKGIRGVVVSTAGLKGMSRRGNTLHMGAGLPISEGAAYAAEEGLEGLDFIYAMPGSVGGALWMNARCYGGEIAEVLGEYRVLDETLTIRSFSMDRGQWGYKRSPFQNQGWVILEAGFTLCPGDPAALRARMEEIKADREAKGHFRAPCGGSTFKNNRSFGAPSGKIIEEVGLKGLTLGGAAVSPWHGNILINKGNAKAAELAELIEIVQERVAKATGFHLETEVLKVGDWS